MNRSNKAIAILLVVAVSLGLAGCATGGGEEASSAADLKIVLFLPGPINDQSWNAANYAGLVKCNETLGTSMEYVENLQTSDFESTFRNYAERGYDLILAAGIQFDEAANTVAADYPDTMFTVVNGLVADHANVAPIFPKEYEASYIAGIIAGDTTENGQFGVIGAFPSELMENLLDVYEEVAVETAEANGIAGSAALRAYANSWEDVALGKQMTETLIDNGVDVMFVYANQVGLGAIQAAKEKGAKFIGFAGDQTTIDPDTVVASILFDFETFYVWAVDKFIQGELEGNQIYMAGITEGIFTPVYTEHVSDETKAKVDAAIEAVLAGEIDFEAMFK